jgi:subtilase family serine protease
MRSSRVIVLAATLLAAITSLSVGAAPAAAAPSQAPASNMARACSSVPATGFARCFAQVRKDVHPMSAQQAAAPLATVAGLGPADLVSAYKLPSATAGTGQTIAIVDAMDDPTAEADLGTYRSQFGLAACTTANGCFRKVDQNGGTSFPATDSGWALEISLDLDMASAICPNCHILLVEASSASFANLGTAVNRAATMGANAISNSYGGSDQRENNSSPYNHLGIAVTASSGDNGFGVSYPATSRFVTSVGGTSLTAATNSRGWTESAWSGAGSGCSRFQNQLSVQANVNTGCRGKRATADVSAVADPNTGVAVFDSTPFQNQSGWFVVGGTSASSPIIAGVFALAGNAGGPNNTTNFANFPYSNPSALFDVTTGNNGSCRTTVQCTAGTGWDGPTGLGTPNGVTDF